MDLDFRAISRRLFGPDSLPPGYLAARWLFLRALGLIFFSAFYSLAFQIYGLIGQRGILPAASYLSEIAGAFGPLKRVWYAPTLLWLDSGDTALRLVVAGGLIASALLVLNVWPRLMVGIS